MKTFKSFLLNEWGEIEEKSEYQGRKVTLNKPTKGDVKKSKVYVKNAEGNVVKVEFGDPDMEIKVDDPARRRSFRARHNCENPGPKWKAKYWSCRMWEEGKSVSDVLAYDYKKEYKTFFLVYIFFVYLGYYPYIFLII